MGVDLRALPDPYPIVPAPGPLDADVHVPGSKSITNRALVCAALAEGATSLEGALFADDTRAMVGVLRHLGIEIGIDEQRERITLLGCAGRLPATDEELDVRQSGTTSRFTLPMLALGTGSYGVTAHPQMLARPMRTTFDALVALGATVEPRDEPGHLPVTVRPGSPRSVELQVPGDISSQFLSGLLMVGPCLPDGLVVHVTTELVSRPYVDMTIGVMRAFGASVDEDDATFVVHPGGYRGRTYAVEPDASAASYPWAAAAIRGGRVRVAGLGRSSIQGDMAFVEILRAMGAKVTQDDTSTTVEGGAGALHAGTFDLRDCSDTAPTLAVVAPFAAAPVAITGIGFIRRKESDRVTAVADELGRCGIPVRIDDDGWTIGPAHPRPAIVQTYDDHRIAMSFALLGLVTEGIQIADPACVGKTFPGYWDLLDQLRGDSDPAGRV